MPIDEAEFQKGEAADSFENKAVEFLNKSKGKAFSTEEVMNGAGFGPKSDSRMNAVKNLADKEKYWTKLFAMSKKGRIQSKRVKTGGKTEHFWMAK